MPQNNTSIYIYGRKPVLETLENEANRIEKIFVRNSLHDSQLSKIFELASQYRIPISHVPGSKLFDLVGKVNDQGIVALMSKIQYEDFGEWLDSIDLTDYPAILLLDQIQDPGNLGAILRTAAASGISAALLPKHGQAPVNAATYKASAGTAGRIPIVRVGNLNQTLISLKEEGFWIGGLDMGGEQKLWDLKVDRPLAFVIGNEGNGISKKTLEHCDYRFRIPMENRVESLNASVSAALLCYEWKRKIDS